VAKRVKLTRSGGLAGLSMVADVDLDELPGAVADDVRAALAQVDFDRPRTAQRPGAADTYQYDLVVGSGRRRSLTAHEPLSDPGLQAVVDMLLPLAHPE